MRINYFNFKEFENKVLITNDLGCHLFLTKNDFKKLLKKEIDINSDIGKELIERNFIFEHSNLEYSSLLKHDMRRTKNHMLTATSLHIFVVTTACNMHCVYCQANNGFSSSSLYMTKELAQKAVDIALQSPAENLTFEFQGGEPLLNFDVVKFIVEYSEEHKGNHNIQYNVVTNLTLITDEIIDFFKEYEFGISTSIDGPSCLHNENRPFKNGAGTFEQVEKAIKIIREKELHIGAIQTTTKASLAYPKEIVQTYKNLGFESVFLRPLTPLGKATLNWDKIGYTAEEFLGFYTKALEEIIKINQEGHFFKEDHATILLSKIDGRFVNYMELRSPCGAGIGQLAYFANGEIFTCDEGRMLYEMGDSSFKLGNVNDNTYTEIINNGVCKSVCASSILESIPNCCDCVYQPYCGTCPVVNYAKSQDIIEKEPRGYRCSIYSGLLDFLFKQLLENNNTVIDILKGWSN